ncbi:hypothetical protein BGW36DRAFT_422916 [Talaromyces proteolyticus]|uniref:NmrA-like domain-containing protein n=1 Tax=Talaromyces proteolyticus TaxID=1131652 RepID=A0AAD4Q263_9EURO|nr:uncharacterized protein BGW36DRAFT_422916 [Talaromyces proteolyticus]KAH8703352.1 hypothetical protein BGW36DRAFT_422916 [Talaromyces proteolyticus]
MPQSLRNPAVRQFPSYAGVSEISNYLQARSDKINWTIVAPGGFLEYVFDLPFVLELANRKIEIINGGDIPFSVSEFGTTAKWIIGVLRQPKRGVDHCVQTHATTVTQNEVFGLVKKYDPNPESWTVLQQESNVKLERGMGMIKNGDFSMNAISTMMSGIIWSGDYNLAFKETDNEWLGVEMITKERLEELIEDKVIHGATDVGSSQIVSNVG